MKNNDTFIYFAYGSNLDPERLYLNCPSAQFLSAGKLYEYTLNFTKTSEIRWRGGVADIVETPNASMWGAIWQINISESDALDRQEGVHANPQGYHRLDITVESADGRSIECRTYQVTVREALNIPPSPAYKETLVRGAKYCELPADYQTLIANIKDNGRAGGDPRLEP
ncbi:MAG: gamma-glutamylcyclotransferase [Dehalococcoidia bacterium]|nr:gamma-glutamylcyclotransferase [Dehalococcoidia bacterium]